MKKSLSKRIIEKIRRGDYEVLSSQASLKGGRVIDYYTVDSPNVHIAIWPNWNVVSGVETHKRFYPICNPAYKYLNSYERDIENFERYTVPREQMRRRKDD